MTRKQVYTYGGIFLGLTALGLTYYFVVYNKATEDQFLEFENNATGNNYDFSFNEITAGRRLALINMWKKNLTRKQANRLIYFSTKKPQSLNAGEMLEMSRLISIWQERPIKQA